MPTHPYCDSSWRTILIGLLFYFGFIPLLAVVPYWFPVDPDIVSAAAVEGYNTAVAYYSLVMWTLLGIVAFALWQRTKVLQPANDETTNNGAVLDDPRGEKARTVLICIAVFVLSIIVYSPPFLSRYGPFTGDSYFLSVLYRMHCGYRPYLEFDFLYGPLMLYPAFYWAKVFGYSMISYYGYLAVLEGLQFAILITVLRRVIPDRRFCLVAFCLLVPFLLNTSLGLHGNGMRRLIPVFAVLLITMWPNNLRTVVIGAVISGLALSYSHDYGLASLVALVGMYCCMAIRREGLQTVYYAGVLVIIAIIVWYGTTRLLMGESFAAYIDSTLHIVRRYTAGSFGFRFYWTANSLALFGLLALACIQVGRGFFGKMGRHLESGDSLLLSSLLFALIGLKSGLNRPDLWHLNAPFILLFFAYLLPLPTSIFRITWGSRRLALSLIVVASATYLVGLAPAGSYVAAGYVKGLRDWITDNGTGNVQKPNLRNVSIENERSNPNPHILRLGEYLAENVRSEYPVFRYGTAWGLDTSLGICKTQHSIDDNLFLENRKPIVQYLQQNPDALVIMNQEEFMWLFGVIEQSEIAADPLIQDVTVTKSIASWLSTVHFRVVQVEKTVKYAYWKRIVGDYIRVRYRGVAQFGSIVVLARPARAQM